MEKLTLQQLAVYLPYGLKGNLINNEYYEPVINGELFRIETGKTTKNSYYDPYVIVDDCEDEIKYFKPILYPIYMLTKEITHGGRTFIPIVELFKMAAFRKYEDYEHNLFTLMKIKTENYTWLRINTGFPVDTELLFYYENGHFVFKKIAPRYEDIEIIRQWEMFQKLADYVGDSIFTPRGNKPYVKAHILSTPLVTDNK